MVTMAQYTQELQGLQDQLGILQNEILQLRGDFDNLPMEALDRDLRERLTAQSRDVDQKVNNVTDGMKTLGDRITSLETSLGAITARTTSAADATRVGSID